MGDALGPWDGPALDARSGVYAALWQPLLGEGLIGSADRPAAAVLDQGALRSWMALRNWRTLRSRMTLRQEGAPATWSRAWPGCGAGWPN